MKRFFAVTFLALFSMSALSACNTIGGAGEDIEKGGEAVQDAAS
ncbi:entericidin A/B family lipoprotein [Phytohalomonas tamaricis]|nr:entericidin A/B family lipoprotein [Phytohalomonas tamaricis]